MITPKRTLDDLFTRHRRYFFHLVKRYEAQVPSSERDDLAGEASLELARKFPTLRMEGARKPEALEQTWIRWQIRAAVRRLQRRHKGYGARRNGDDVPLHAAVDLDAWGGDPAEVERDERVAIARVAIARAWSEARPRDRALMSSVLRDENDPDTLRRRYDTTVVGRSTRLASLGRRLSEDVDVEDTQLSLL